MGINHVCPRILLLSEKRAFINPTRALFLHALTKLSNVYLHGPGHSKNLMDVKTLDKRHGPFDVVVIDSSIYSNVEVVKWPLDLFEADLPIIVLALMDDLHGGTPKEYDRLQKEGVVVLSTGSGWQFFDSSRKELLRREKGYEALPYVFAHPEVIGKNYILFPHCIAEDEFMPVQKHWKYDLSVPGVLYYFRQKVLDIARRSELKMGPRRGVGQKIIGRIESALSITQGIYYRRFRRGINRSRMTVTCDGTVGYPIRKFFEIPAFGSVLAASFFPNAEQLGFLDKENCFYLHHPEEVLELAETLKNSDSFAYEIALKGQQMVRENHSVRRRVEQFMMIAASHVERRLETARWEAGDLVLVEH